MDELSKTIRSTLVRAKKRGSYNKEDVYQLIDDTKLGNVAFLENGSPIVIPMLVWRMDDFVYLHGSRIARIFERLPDQEIAISFTELTEWVLAKSAFHHSANYRSAVLFGKPELVEDESLQLLAYESFINQIQDGRWSKVRHPNDKEMKATAMVRMQINEGSFKSRMGGPNDDKDDLELPVWAGVIPVNG